MPILLDRKGPHRANDKKPIMTVHKLVDKLVEQAQKYGDQPPVVMVRTRFGYDRYVITEVQMCGGQDHTLLMAEPEQ